MVIAICILGGLLLCSLFVIAAMWMAIGKLMDDYMDDNPKGFMRYYFDYQTEERYPCTLLLSIKEGADFDGSVYDFSQYEEKKIIGLTEYKKETTSNGRYDYEDGEPLIAPLPNQVVCKMKDGSFQWDFRSLM